MPDANEKVVLLDPANRQCGTADKLAAHRLGLRHSAFSIFVLDDEGRILLQRRALTKYHSAGLWANTCCGHPRPQEQTASAAARRLREEMGMSCELTPAGAFLYRAAVGNGLIEHEYDHVFVATCTSEPNPSADEVMDWRWVEPAQLRSEIAARPEEFAVWISPALDALASHDPGRARLL